MFIQIIAPFDYNIRRNFPLNAELRPEYEILCGFGTYFEAEIPIARFLGNRNSGDSLSPTLSKRKGHTGGRVENMDPIPS